MKSSVLAVGTEITDGQIINRNSSWLSERLKKLGARTIMHLAVPDDRPRILQSLRLLENESDFIFVTGGLGPTTDDFTRDLIAEWAERPLLFNDQAWKLVQERLSSRGYPIQEFQKQQCFFPEGSTLMWNTQGTAHAFTLEVRGKQVFVLPGPPREIDAIWEDHLHERLRDLTKGLDVTLTKSWDILGLGESQVATIVEPLLAAANMEIGYRVHLPYVELKLSASSTRRAELERFAQIIDETLGSWICLRDGEDAAHLLVEKLKGIKNIHIEDQVTGSFLMQRLSSPLRPVWSARTWTFSSLPTPPAANTDLHLWIRPVDEHEVRVGWSWRARSHECRIETPTRSILMAERRLQQFSELALLFWLKGLQDVSL